MRRGLAAILVAALLAPAPAVAKVYSGAELEALVCAHLVAASAYALEAEGMLSRDDRNGAAVWSMLILDRYVSGTVGQKMKALKEVGARRSLVRTIIEFGQNARACQRRFPIR